MEDPHLVDGMHGLSWDCQLHGLSWDCQLTVTQHAYLHILHHPESGSELSS